jgi:hypothetical protein
MKSASISTFGARRARRYARTPDDGGGRGGKTAVPRWIISEVVAARKGGWLRARGDSTHLWGRERSPAGVPGSDRGAWPLGVGVEAPEVGREAVARPSCEEAVKSVCRGGRRTRCSRDARVRACERRSMRGCEGRVLTRDTRQDPWIRTVCPCSVRCEVAKAKRVEEHLEGTFIKKMPRHQII